MNWDRITKLCDEKGWTQVELAAAIRPTAKAPEISRFKTGEREPSLEWLRRIATALGVKLSDVLPEEDVSDRLSAIERDLLYSLKSDPDYDPNELLHMMRALKRFVAQQGMRRVARGSLPGDPVTVVALADVWADLDERQRTKAVDLMRTVASMAMAAPMAAE